MGKGRNNSPACASVKHISECFIKPNLDEDEKKQQPIYLAPWDIMLLNSYYIQKGLLFNKPKPKPLPSSCSSSHDIPTLLRHLKDALSVALAHFYPLVGQLETQTYFSEDTNNNGIVISIDPCKGPGARFIHATLDLTVTDLISPPNHDDEDDGAVTAVVQSLFDHHRAINYDGHTRPLLSVQVTELVDGIFIGCSMNHTCGDGTSYWHFWNSWSEISTKLISGRGGDPPFAPVTLSRPPIHTRFFIDRSGTGGFKLPFTHPDQFVVRFDSPGQLKERIFRFSSESIRKNKARANCEIANMKDNDDDDNNPNPTTRTTTMISSFQALSALVWRCVIRARLRCHQLQAPDQETTCKLAISNRPRLDPPLSENYFGNSLHVIQASCKAEQLMEQSLGWAAMRLNRAVAAHDDKVVRGFLESWMRAPQVFGPGNIYDPGTVMMGSSPRFDMYGNEFGVLGKPVCVLTGYANKFDGKASSFPGREGGGSVDLEICLLPDIMCALESDEEFMSVVTA